MCFTTNATLYSYYLQVSECKSIERWKSLRETKLEIGILTAGACKPQHIITTNNKSSN